MTLLVDCELSAGKNWSSGWRDRSVEMCINVKFGSFFHSFLQTLSIESFEWSEIGALPTNHYGGFSYFEQFIDFLFALWG